MGCVALLGERLSPGSVWGGALLLGSVVFLYVKQLPPATEPSTTGQL